MHAVSGGDDVKVRSHVDGGVLFTWETTGTWDSGFLDHYYHPPSLPVPSITTIMGG